MLWKPRESCKLCSKYKAACYILQAKFWCTLHRLSVHCHLSSEQNAHFSVHCLWSHLCAVERHFCTGDGAWQAAAGSAPSIRSLCPKAWAPLAGQYGSGRKIRPMDGRPIWKTGRSSTHCAAKWCDIPKMFYIWTLNFGRLYHSMQWVIGLWLWLDLSNQSEHCCWTNLRILAWVWPLPFLAASEFWTPVTSSNENSILRTKRGDKCFKFKGCNPAALNAHCSIFVVSSSPWSWWWLPVQLHYCWLGKIQLKGHLLFVQLRLKRLWVWTKILTIFGLLLPPPIFLWVCRRQIASNPLLLLQVHGSSLMKGSRDLWDPEGPIHLFHCTKSPHALGVLI